jgi:hypothetical protein
MADAYIRLRKFKDAIRGFRKSHRTGRPEDVIYEAIGHCYDKLKILCRLVFITEKLLTLIRKMPSWYLKFPELI